MLDVILLFYVWINSHFKQNYFPLKPLLCRHIPKSLKRSILHGNNVMYLMYSDSHQHAGLQIPFMSMCCSSYYWHWTPLLNQYLILDLWCSARLTSKTPHHGHMCQVLEIFWFVTLSRRDHQQQVGRCYRRCPTSYIAQDGQLKQGIIQLQMSRVPRTRSPDFINTASSSNSSSKYSICYNLVSELMCVTLEYLINVTCLHPTYRIF